MPLKGQQNAGERDFDVNCFPTFSVAIYKGGASSVHFILLDRAGQTGCI